MLANICAAVALEQPAAAHREQGVADEGDALGREVIGDMAGGVRRHLHHLRLDPAEADDVAFAHRHVERRDARRFGGRAGHGAAGRRLDLGIAAGVIGMPVGVPDRADLPAPPPRLLEHRLGDGGIDHRRLARIRIVDEPDIIVRQSRDADDLEHGRRIRRFRSSNASASRPSRSVNACAPSARPSRAAWPAQMRAEAERRERQAGERERRRLRPDRAEIVDQPRRQAAREAAAVEIGEGAYARPPRSPRPARCSAPIRLSGQWR